MSGSPTVFISYSWDDDEHKTWVRELAERLVLNGVHVKLDQWDVVPGDSLTEFMEAQITACDFVLVICTPEYARKSTARTGGVGYEQQIISGSLTAGVPRRKFIPLVRRGDMKAGDELAIPPHFQGILAIDMRSPTGINDHVEALLRTVFKVPALSAPPLGPAPTFAHTASAGPQPARPARLSAIEFDGWELASGVALNEQHPTTFWIPTADQRSNVIPTDYVKLNFKIAADDPESDDGISVIGERMWVQVKSAYGPYLWGTLANNPTFEGKEIGLEHGSEVIFLPEHIIDIESAAEQKRKEQKFLAKMKAKKARKSNAKSNSGGKRAQDRKTKGKR
jgi:hypothetical protein